ncbi:MAG: hypothetical protein ACLPPF_19485 [Rhodomicrobium sp.]
MIVGAFGGAAYCDLYCEFDVPLAVYPDFIAAVDEAGPEDVDAAAYATDEAAFADLPPEDVASARAERAHGWSKAVAVLEEAAEEEDREVAETTKEGGEAEAVIDTPDETVDVVVEDEKK